MNILVGAKHTNKAAGLVFLGHGIVAAFYSAAGAAPALILPPKPLKRWFQVGFGSDEPPRF